MGNRKDLVNIEELKLLPETHDFFDTRTSRAVDVFLYSIMGIFLCLIVFLSFAKMDDVVKASAVLRPIDNISELKCLTSGEIIIKNYVQNQSVTKGDLLLKIDCKTDENELEILRSQKEHYTNQLAISKKILSIVENDFFDNEIDYIIENELSEINDLNFVEARSLILEYKKMKLQIEDLENQYNLELQKPKTLVVPQKIEECKNQLEQAKLSLSSWKNTKLLSIKELIQNYEEKKQSIDSRIVTLERSIKNAHLYAPISGFIDEQNSLNVGDFILAGSDVVKIIPKDSEFLKAEIVIDSSKIAQVEIGQEVKLRFQGLPPSSFGQLYGSIKLIPADITIVSGVPVFIVEADISEPYLYSKKGDQVKLRAGLSAEARIIVSRNSMLKMILKKLDFIN